MPTPLATSTPVAEHSCAPTPLTPTRLVPTPSVTITHGTGHSYGHLRQPAHVWQSTRADIGRLHRHHSYQHLLQPAHLWQGICTDLTRTDTADNHLTRDRAFVPTPLATSSPVAGHLRRHLWQPAHTIPAMAFFPLNWDPCTRYNSRNNTTS